MGTENVMNGRAFEFALANAVADHLKKGQFEFVSDSESELRVKAYESRTAEAQKMFARAAMLPMETLFRLEPGLGHASGIDDRLFIRFNNDATGRDGDVRDVVLFRKNRKGSVVWEIGLSAKNNHDAVKHSRLSETNDFAKSWLGAPCSNEYWTSARRIFGKVDEWRNAGTENWNEVEHLKEESIYVPLLKAFRKEIMRIYECDHKATVESLISYLIGKFPFYKVIKYDGNGMVIMQAFNLVPGLGEAYAGTKPDCRPKKIPYPSRIVEFDFADKKPGTMKDTMTIIMDHGWQIDFRIHSGDGKLSKSAKFDTRLTGNPPILFTQHLF